VEPPYLLYDLITYRESSEDQEELDFRPFLDEVVMRWKDGFLGEVALQKKKFEEIALGGMSSAVHQNEVEK
jgi:hypothetical protein